MIIDADTHITPTGGEFSIERHIERMDEHGIDAALTWLAPDYDGTGIEAHNRYVYDASRRYPDRVIPFGWADPTISVEHAKDMVRRCTEEYGFAGVKMNGAQNDYYIDDPHIAMPVAETIARAGAMLAFHIGPDEYEKTHPLRAARIAARFPETTILLVHMGMADSDMNEATIRAAEEYPNMYLIGSGTTAKHVHRAATRLGAERVLFGTDSPFKFTAVALAMYKALLETEFADREHDLIMGGNMQRLFSIAG